MSSRNLVAPSSIAVDEEAAKRNRARIDADRAELVRREERRVWRYEQRLAACVSAKAVARATKALRRARKRLELVKLNGSV